MKSNQRRTCFVGAILLAALASTGCLEVDSLPTQPNQPGIVLQTHVQDWREEVIYQLLTDRFHDSDINNNYNVDKRSMSCYHGGDWQGIIDKLDYLQELGVTTLWISPVVKNVEEDAGFASYHGYWTQDFIKHNPHYGDLYDLRALSDELHKRGMKLILDIVTNHVGQAFFYDVNMNGKADDYLSGYGYAMQGSGWDKGEVVSNLSRVTEFDPDWEACGVQAFTSLGLAGQAPIIFFNNPAANRVPPGPQNIDLNGDGIISEGIEKMGFSNPDWYHKKGRVSDWDKQLINGELASPPYTHRFTNADGTLGNYIDGTARQYYQNDQTLLADFPGGLKDIATEREDVRLAMIQAFSYWIDVTDCDGFRIDTLKHVEYSFWETFAPAIRAHAQKRGKSNFFMYGEAFDGNDDLLAAYTQSNQVDSVFLFSQKYAIDQVFKCSPGNTAVYCNGTSNGTAALYGWYSNGQFENRVEKFNGTPQPNGVTDASGKGIAPRQLLVNFLDNHDVGRYLFDRPDAKGIDSLKNALTYIFTTNGIPCIYYGTEQGFYGGNDPSNREDMDDITASIYYKYPSYGYNYTPWNTDNPIFLHIKNLIRIRKAVPPLTKGTYTVDWYSSSTGSEDEAGIFAFHRTYNNQSAVVVVNTHETATKMTRGTVGSGGMPTPFGSNAQLVDLLDASYTVSTDSTGTAIVSVPPMKTRILVKQADKASYGL